MRRAAAILVLLSVVLLAGCDWILSRDTAQLVIESTPYGYDATVDFGLANPDGAPVVLAGALENLLGRDVTVESVEVDGDSFSVETPTLPATIAGGEGVEVSLSFAPTGSGDKSGTVTIVFAERDEPFVLNLAGEGNYAPVAYAAVTVTGAGTSAVNGTYIRTGTQGQYSVRNWGLDIHETYDTPSYELPGTVYRIWAAESDAMMGWVIDDDFAFDGEVNTALYGYQYSDWALVAPSGDEGWFWPMIAGASSGPTVTGEIDAPNGEIAQPFETLTANYAYVDEEGDAEGASTFQWLISDFMNGPFSSISGETAATLDVVEDMNLKYLAVVVTPVAQSGIATGEPAFLGPIAVIWM